MTRRRGIPLAVLAILLALGAWFVVAQWVLLEAGDPPEAGPFGPAATLLAQLVGVALAAARVVARREARLAWGLLTAGALALALGDLVWLVIFHDAEEVAVPSAADALYVAIYPLSFAGLVLLARARLTGVGRTLWLDGLVAAAAAAALTAQLVFPTVLAGLEGEPLEVATNLSYPVGDLVLLFIVVAAVGLAGWRFTADWVLIALSLLLVAATDALYLVDLARDRYFIGIWYDNGWAIGTLLLAFAAWVPTPATRVVTAAGVRMIAVPLGFAFVGLGLLAAGTLRGLHPVATGLATLSVLTVFVRLAVTFSDHAGLLRATTREALTDALTGLGNRRRLALDLADRRAAERFLVLCDLDGFKQYNDHFGHPAGDALLTRLGDALARAARAHGGSAYRMGGDEFCALLPPGAPVEAVVGALTEQGEGFAIGASRGIVLMPLEAGDPDAALLLADRRLYAHKHSRRAPAGRQSSDVLLRAVKERRPDLDEHAADVADLAEATARELEMDGPDVETVRQAAELHDVGKIAIPDAVLDKPGSLEAGEWEFIRRHSEIGERILLAAPALAVVAPLVRSSHERWDGTGYPDGLRGEAIPLGARVVAVCDAFDAMTTDRPYRAATNAAAAIDELERCAGVQFDPRVVAAFARAHARQAASPPPALLASAGRVPA